MKKLILMLLVVAIMSHVGCTEKEPTVNIPVVVESAFKAKFPNATKAKWEMENKTKFEVNFNLSNEEVSANFDSAGTWLETETEIEASALPAAAQATINADFANFKINEASKIERVKSGTCYEAEIEKGEETFDVLLTTDGKVLSKTKVEEKEEDKED
ncbi:MAG: PepSY-like domain-containing protein [Bacteroidota bacterium]|nr:PepSY-like domain-containing protein [Bacteroidota bacterium]